ncbi:MAG: hypothetical protein EOO90_17460 [Pedobacter sp.]|nr:MAG: hypothetical protein EOO90_17460 [Pedobacter sp.]
MGFLKRFFNLKDENPNTKSRDGWTETKVHNDTYFLNIPQEQKDKWTSVKHERDNVSKLIKKDGFYDKPHGRTGTIYHVNDGKLCEIDYEISGVAYYDILIYFDGTKEWLLPEKRALSSVERTDISEKLKLWLTKKNIKAEL